MNGDQLEAVKRESGFEDWRDRNTLGEGLFVWRYALCGHEVPGGSVYLDQRVEVPAPPSSENLAAARVLRLIQSLWRLSDRPEGPALRLDLYECASRAAAHEMLLHLLAQVQIAPLSRREELEIGDVAFAAAGETALVFARANLAVVVSNAGRALVPIPELARAFDVDLVRKPEPPEPPEPEIATVVAAAEAIEPAARVRVGEAVPIDLAERELAPEAEAAVAAVEAGPPPTLKLFYRQGEVAWEKGGLVYHPTAPGRQEVEVYTVGPTGAARRRSFQVDAE